LPKHKKAFALRTEPNSEKRSGLSQGEIEGRPDRLDKIQATRVAAAAFGKQPAVK